VCPLSRDIAGAFASIHEAYLSGNPDRRLLEAKKLARDGILNLPK
jgi:hypothetical protein